MVIDTSSKNIIMQILWKYYKLHISKNKVHVHVMWIFPALYMWSFDR